VIKPGDLVEFSEPKIGRIPGRSCGFICTGEIAVRGTVVRVEPPDPFGIVWAHVDTQEKYPRVMRIGMHHLRRLEQVECAIEGKK
jgi:hypothetical protein